MTPRHGMKGDAPHILLINPWIHDFAAYDFWASPLGLLLIAGKLRAWGLSVSYLDCLDRFHPQDRKTELSWRYGRGSYHKTVIDKPKGFSDINRTFSRYGVKIDWFLQDLKQIAPPDLILLTCVMTYWYPGLFEAIRLVRSVFPQTPVVIGGIYAMLCREHALRYAGADEVCSSPDESAIADVIRRYAGFDPGSAAGFRQADELTYPAFDLQHQIPYVPLMTSTGCPFRCKYCASAQLSPRRSFRAADSVIAEIQYWRDKYGVQDFVIYDDAFLINAETHAIPLLTRIIDLNINVRFHTPNALHIREISETVAGLLFRAGFKTIRLGLETATGSERGDLDRKVGAGEFEIAARWLKKAGFQAEQVGAYLLAGLPGQSPESIRRSIDIVKNAGVSPILAYYSPIPHTALWREAVACSRYDLAHDPIYSNNSVMPCSKDVFSWKTLSALKLLTQP